MQKNTFRLVLVVVFISVRPAVGGQVLRKSIQAKVRESGLIVIARVEDVKPGKVLDKQYQSWRSLCSIQQVLKGDAAEEVIAVDLRLPVKGIIIEPAPQRLSKGTEYILFLRRS